MLLSVMLLGGGLLSTGVLAANADRAEEEDHWVRTRDGWERASHLHPQPVYEPTLHPAVFTAFLSLTALLTLAASTPRPSAAADVATADNAAEKRVAEKLAAETA